MEMSHTQSLQKLQSLGEYHRVFGSHFYENKLTRHLYLDFLWQQINWIHQYGFRRDYLHNTFLHRWTRARGEVEWPPHSPVLTPLDFQQQKVIRKGLKSCKIWKTKFESDIINNVRGEFLDWLGILPNFEWGTFRTFGKINSSIVVLIYKALSEYYLDMINMVVWKNLNDVTALLARFVGHPVGFIHQLRSIQKFEITWTSCLIGPFTARLNETGRRTTASKNVDVLY